MHAVDFLNESTSINWIEFNQRMPHNGKHIDDDEDVTAETAATTITPESRKNNEMRDRSERKKRHMCLKESHVPACSSNEQK